MIDDGMNPGKRSSEHQFKATIVAISTAFGGIYSAESRHGAIKATSNFVICGPQL